MKVAGADACHFDAETISDELVSKVSGEWLREKKGGGNARPKGGRRKVIFFLHCVEKCGLITGYI